MHSLQRFVALAIIGLLALLGSRAIAADPAPIKIGMIVPMTGPIAESGRYGIQGAKLAVEDINKAGGVLGRPLELVIEDDQSTNPSTILATRTSSPFWDQPAARKSSRSRRRCRRRPSRS
jgi:branched-chain amino acid transport system substrate-binding protein